MKQKILFFLILILSLFLRVYKLDQIPPSPYWEEVALGYDAYSISETLHDHHGNFLPLVAFESFGDWKPSLYFYAIVPFIKLIGLNVWAVRLPSAIAGVFIVWGVGELIAELVSRKAGKLESRLKLIGMAVTAVSPWAIQFSRGGWEVNLATALILWGVVFFFRYLNGLRNTDHGSRKFFSVHSVYLVYSVVLLSLSMYSYHAARVVAPLLGIGLAVLYLIKVFISHKAIKQYIIQIMLVGVLALFLTSPILISMTSPVGNQRFAETSIFTDLSIIEESNQFRVNHNNALWARLVSHRFLLFSREVAKNFASHFSPRFLFISGDSNPRHSIQSVGTFYWVDGLFMIAGILFILFQSSRASKLQSNRDFYLFLFYWLVVGILPASITYGAPHALRILLTLPVWMILIAFGIGETLSLMSKIQNQNVKSNLKSKFKIKSFGIYLNFEIWHLALIGLFIVYLFSFSNYWHQYTNVYPQAYAHEWQYGYEQVVSKLNSTIAQYPNSQIYFTREQGRPAMYYWFYNQTDPSLVQAADVTAKQDQGEYLEFENINFVRTINEVPTDQNAIVVYGEGSLLGSEVVDEVISLDGETMFKIGVIDL